MKRRRGCEFADDVISLLYQVLGEGTGGGQSARALFGRKSHCGGVTAMARHTGANH